MSCLNDGSRRLTAALLLATLCLPAPALCTPFDPGYLSSNAETERDRARETHRFDGVPEKQLLAASVSVLQDLGFTINRSDEPLGLILGVKNREAKATDQKIAMMTLMLLTAIATENPNLPNTPMREDQTISVMLTIRPVPGKGPDSHYVRVTFHRLLRQPMRTEAGILRQAALYRDFDELLSKAIFLEEHKL